MSTIITGKQVRTVSCLCREHIRNLFFDDCICWSRRYGNHCVHACAATEILYLRIVGVNIVDSNNQQPESFRGPIAAQAASDWTTQLSELDAPAAGHSDITSIAAVDPAFPLSLGHNW